MGLLLQYQADRRVHAPVLLRFSSSCSFVLPRAQVAVVSSFHDGHHSCGSLLQWSRQLQFCKLILYLIPPSLQYCEMNSTFFRNFIFVMFVSMLSKVNQKLQDYSCLIPRKLFVTKTRLPVPVWQIQTRCWLLCICECIQFSESLSVIVLNISSMFYQSRLDNY